LGSRRCGDAETTIDGEYDGKVSEHARWTLTFTRIS
jgi:hypothetical protein